MLSVWFRVIRIRFLLSSVIAVVAGLALNWWQNSSVDVVDAALTLGGVAALHASVDLLNDYWDFKRGIDAETARTGMSGGTGVLPEGLLEPKQVYRAGVAFLVAGASVGSYFVFTDGVVVAALLGFAVISIYFYSTKIVDSGLAEIFVTVKGACIVLGTYFIQAGDLTASAVVVGAIIGVLSATVLLVTSFPDYEADKRHGRKTLAVALGRRRAASLFWAFPAVSYGLILLAVTFALLPPLVLIALLAAPIAIASGVGLQRSHSDASAMVPVMSTAIKFARTAGALLAIGLVLSAYT